MMAPQLWPVILTIALLAAPPAYVLLQPPKLMVYSGADPTPITCPPKSSDDGALSRFSQLLQFSTVSDASCPFALQNPREFDAMLQFLAQSYAPLWKLLEVEKVGPGGYSRLLTWHGSNETLLPMLFVSHYDVVPVHRPQDWEYPPFSGAVADGFVHGRGALDIKFSVSALLEAASDLAVAGHRPERTLMFAFGQDEECGGKGAAATAALLMSRGVRVEAVLDEGGSISWDGWTPFTKHPVAFVGTAEKGFEQVDVVIRSAGGHSGVPPLDGSDVASQAARLVAHLQAHPMPAALQPPAVGMLQVLAAVTPHTWLRPLLLRAGTWPLSWVMTRVMLRLRAQTAAMVRTTAAVTWLQVGIADNVLPQQSRVSINFRLATGTTRKDVLQYTHDAVRAAHVDAMVSLANSHSAVAAAATPATSFHFRLVKQAIQELWQYNGKAIPVAPYTLGGITDSRHYAELSENGILRFVPYATTKEDKKGVHGTNERVAVDSYRQAICTYKRLLQLFST